MAEPPLHLRIQGVRVEAAGQDSMLQGLQGKDRLHGTCTSKQMPQLPLGCADGQMIGGGTQASPQGPSFRQISQACAGGMGLYGTKVVSADTRSTQSIINGSAGLKALGLRGDDVMRITAAA